ncbi:MAG TPA: rod shape-determining protein MreD [Planctomycetes bacterium]|nr:rod shape-determining protein MreD [Planctomycetota bacterium]HIJ70164.1 rod shape-determining protein MreD [Planctomycetota bacterium]
MRWFRFSILLFFFTLLSAGNLLNSISLSDLNIRPDLLLILLVFLAVNSDTTDAIIASFAVGFAADISGSSIGPITISFGLVGSVISQMRKVVIMKRMVHQASAIFVAGAISGVLIHFLTFFKTGETASNVYVVVLGTCLYSAVAGPVIWVALTGLSVWLGVRKHRFGRYSGR